MKPWTAETPNLYRVTYSLNGKDTRSVNIGFRSVEIADNGAVLINGRAVKFKGVNRHEAHPDYGRAIPREVMEKDVQIIKAHNIIPSVVPTIPIILIFMSCATATACT